MVVSSSYIRWFETIRLEDVPLVGGKNASLGELYCELGEAGVKIPNGFALTVAAYADALTSAKAWAGLHALLDDLDITDVNLLAERAAKARQIVYDATGSEELRADIKAAYHRLETQYGLGVAVAVRSSATAEDLPTASFAGQHESYLNIRGIDDLIEACRLCFASVFTDRAIVYRVNNGFDHFKIGLSVGVMKMVRTDRASSGVIFTLDTEFGLPRRGVHYWHLWAGREYRPGQGGPGRVPRAQADLQTGLSRRAAPLARAKAAASHLCRRPYRIDHMQC